MSLQLFLSELEREAVATRKILERVPETEFGWRPHQKSMTLGRIATHVAEIPKWIATIILEGEVNFAGRPIPGSVSTHAELMALYDEALFEAQQAINGASETVLEETWTVRAGDHIIYTTPRLEAIRGWGMNHLVHHRGQLSVYLRLLDIPVPGMYGPSADER